MIDWQGWFEWLWAFGKPLDITGAGYLVFVSVAFTGSLLLSRLRSAHSAWISLLSLLLSAKVCGIWALLLVVTATLDYFIGRALFDTTRNWQKTALLLLSLSVNLGLLVYFKYSRFIAESLSPFNIVFSEDLLSWIVPLGISFYTFRSLSYILDCYQEVIEEPETNYWHYLAFVSFFPTLYAGPISKARETLIYFKKPLELNHTQHAQIIWLVISGLVKKVAVADYLGSNFVDRVFDSPGQFSGLECLIAAGMYGIQLYADFSGYTDIMLAVGLLLGIKLPDNFNEPYKATSLSEFWRRWHISMSSWFSDYVFQPLVFSWRKWPRIWAVGLASLITFTASGIWHGSRWTYLLWGFLHGIGLVYEVSTQKYRKKIFSYLPKWLNRSLSQILLYCFLVFSFILFRCQNLETSVTFFNSLMYQFHFELLQSWVFQYQAVIWACLLGIILHSTPTIWKQKLFQGFENLPWYLYPLIFVITVFCVYQVKMAESLPFVYLQY